MKKKLLSIIIASFLAFGFYAQQYGPIVIFPGGSGSQPRDFKKFNNLLIFTASDSISYFPKIFRSDGTYAGTYPLNNSISVIRCHMDENLEDSAFIKLGNQLFFRGGYNGSNSLWSTDGNLTGTTLIHDFSSQSFYSNLVILNQKLFFLTQYFDPIWGVNGFKLWKYDPINNSVTEIYNWNNLNNTGSVFCAIQIRVFNNKLYFHGWQSDGTNANTIQTNLNLPESSKSCIYNGLIYYPGGSNGNLWRTDGTISGTFQAVDFPVWVNGITVFNNLMYFAGGNVGAGMQGTELCRSDGTLSNTAVVKDIYFGYNSSYPSDFSIVNGSLYFLANDGISGREIYKTDGTSNGTVLLKDIEQGISDSFYPNFYPDERYNSKIQHLNQLYFNVTLYNGTSNGIWKSDGTTANTNQVFQIDTTRSLMDVNGILFFAGYTQNEGWELYAEGLTSEINENSIHSLIKISPNPTSNIITIQGKESMNQNFKIFDQMGREVYKGKLNGITTDVYLTNLSKGIYTLKIDGNYKPAQIVKE
jgi:ELWxxDGT repeat protein